MGNETFTAAQISSALGIAARVVRRTLSSIPITARVLVRGQVTNAWAVDVLPARLREELEQAAKSAGYRDVAGFLSASRWQPAIPLSEVAPHCLAEAEQLRQALALPLRRRNDSQRGELTALGLREYKAVFGCEITPQYWNRLLTRTLDRDAGWEDWDRLEIYLSDQLARKAGAAVTHAPGVDHLAAKHAGALDEYIANMRDQADPTAEDRAFLWDRVFSHFESTSAAMGNRNVVKASLVTYLAEQIPGLSGSQNGLSRAFRRNFKRWVQGGRCPGTLKDQRGRQSGNFRRPDFSTDLEMIAAVAVQHGGNESLAHRLLRQEGKLTPEFCDYYPFEPRLNKSAVPATVRETITPQVNACATIHRGAWQARMSGPHIARDWSGVAPGDWYNADDVTLNHYFWYNDAGGRPQIARGECLVMTDLRSSYPLGFILIPGHYNGRWIRRLVLLTHDDVGLPRKGYYFERGVWKSRFVVGEGQALDFCETEAGLREHGLVQVRHATTPRAKPIEGMFKILQERMRSEPGFVGFNERGEDYEDMQDFLGRVRRGTAHPGERLLKDTEWKERIAQVLMDYAADPQNGKMNPGISPQEMWRAGIERHPLRKLPDEARYVLATHRRAVTVRKCGIVLKVPGLGPVCYANEHTGRLVGQEVLAFVNIDAPLLLTVSDMNREKYFSVKGLVAPAMTATEDQFEDVNRSIAGHNKEIQGLYGNLKHNFVHTVVRDARYSPETKALGAFHNQEVARAQEAQRTETRTLSKINASAATAGVRVNRHMKNPARVLQGLELEKQARERIAQQQTVTEQ